MPPFRSTTDALTKTPPEQDAFLDPNSPQNQDVTTFANQNFGSDGVANAQTPFKLDVPNTIPSTSIDTNVTKDDVFNRRNDLEAEGNTPVVDPLTEVRNNTESEISTSRDYESFIDNAIFGEEEPSAAEIKQQEILDNYLQRTIDIESDLTDVEGGAERKYEIVQREKELAETNMNIASLTKQLRQDLRGFDVNAADRGVSRAFVQDSKAAINAKGRAAIADEYIIQSAQQGNLQQAQGLIKTAVDNRLRAFTIQNQQDQARLDALLPTLEGEEKEEALQLQFALGERSRNIEKQRVEQEGIRNMVVTAANNGASVAEQRQIMQAGSLDEAMLAAGPFIGRYDRMKIHADLANKDLDRRKKLVELALAGDQQAIAELGDYGQYIQNQVIGNVDSENAERETQTANEKIALVDQIIGNELGFDLGTGTFQSPLAASFGVTVPTATTGGAALGSVVPGIGTAIGAAGGLVTGLATGAYTYGQANNARNDFLADMKSLIAPEALDELVRRKEAGATFGALSNAELGLLLQASQQLAGHFVLDQEGNVSEVIGSPQAVEADLGKVKQFYIDSRTKANTSQVSLEEQASIDSI